MPTWLLTRTFYPVMIGLPRSAATLPSLKSDWQGLSSVYTYRLISKQLYWKLVRVWINNIIVIWRVVTRNGVTNVCRFAINVGSTLPSQCHRIHRASLDRERKTFFRIKLDHCAVGTTRPDRVRSPTVDSFLPVVTRHRRKEVWSFLPAANKTKMVETGWVHFHFLHL